MLLSTLLNGLRTIPSTLDREVAGLALSSLAVVEGGAFIAIKGTHSNGAQFISDAIARGAKVVLIESETLEQPIEYIQQVPIIPVIHLKSAVNELAAMFYSYPAKKLRLIGVTGTNGKTSCTNFIAQVLNGTCGIIGTLGNGYVGALQDGGLTTPDPVSLQALFKQFLTTGAKAVAMEVSSHGIDQGRINGLDFEIGVFTNLTQDHLDYHGTMGAYAKVKHRFLANPETKRLVINIDDDYGRAWIDEFKQDKAVYAYSTQQIKISGDYPLICVTEQSFSLNGINAHVVTPWGEGHLTLPLLGKFNLSNALAVLTTLCVYGLPFKQALQSMKQLIPVAGRMQALGGKGRPLVVVDYSHTPDALEKALSALRAHTEGQLICVFGCGGDRDPIKRPIMAKIAERLADKVIVTNDNPRHEQPEAIAEQILGGFKDRSRVLVELDRSKAIENSIQLAKYNDCVLIAGKGAERYQQIGNDKIPFDDVERAKLCLEQY